MKCKKYVYIIMILMLLMLNINGVYATTEGLLLSNKVSVNTQLSGGINIISDSYVTLASSVNCNTIFGSKNYSQKPKF